MFSRFKSNTSVWCVSAAFALTVALARLISYASPRFHWDPIAGLRIHHYVYGIFILTAAGYLALVFKSPRATPWIALIYGIGVGLTFDEFGMWLNPRIERGVRWNYGGLTIVIAAITMSTVIPLLFRRRPRRGELRENTDAVTAFSED